MKIINPLPRLLAGLIMAVSLHGADDPSNSVWRGPRDDLLRQLKEWRAPADIIDAVLAAHANHQTKALRVAANYPDGVKPWRSPSPTPEGRARIQAANKQIAADIAVLLGRPLGAGADQPAADTIWRATKGDLYRQLRQWQAPDDMIVAILFAHDQHLHGAEIQAIRDTVKDRTRLPRIGEIHARAREEIRALMGPDFDLVLLDPGQRAKWGDLTKDQLVKLKRLMEVDLSAALTGETYTDLPMNPEALQRNALIEEKFASEVRTVLGAGASREFLIFNSPAAAAFQKRMDRSGIELDEATYRTLFRRFQELHANFAVQPFRHGYEWGVEEVRLFESVLGPEQAVTLAAAKMGNFQRMDRDLIADQAEAKSRLDIYYLYMETTIRASLARSTVPPDSSPVEQEQIKTDGERLYRLLEAKLSPAHFAKFVASGDGRMIETWRNTGRMR